MANEQAPLLKTIEEIRLKNEQPVEVSEEIKEELSVHALSLMAIQSAIESAS
jgi:hypothetical protein